MLTWHLFKSFIFSGRSGSLVRTISWICISGIGVGVFALIVVMSVMNGFNESIRKRFLAIEPHLVVYFDKKDAMAREKWQKFQSQLLATHPKVSTFYFDQQDIILRTVEGFFAGAQARGVEADALNEILNRIATVKAKGQPVEEFQIDLDPGQIIVGHDLAVQNGIFEGDDLEAVAPESLLLPPGEIPPHAKVMVRSFFDSSVPDLDGGVLYYIVGQSFQNLRRSASRRQGVEIQIPDPMNFEPMQAKIRAAGFEVESWTERNSALFMALKLELFGIGLILGLSTLIASFSVINVLVLVTTQKKKEIGLMMAIGLSPTRTHWLFTRIGMLLSGVGMGGGLLIGTLVSIYIEKNPLDILPDYYQDTRIPALVDYQFIGMVSLFVILIAVFAAWIPAKQVSKLTPVDAIRTKA